MTDYEKKIAEIVASKEAEEQRVVTLKSEIDVLLEGIIQLTEDGDLIAEARILKVAIGKVVKAEDIGTDEYKRTQRILRFSADNTNLKEKSLLLRDKFDGLIGASTGAQLWGDVLSHNERGGAEKAEICRKT